MGLYIVLEKLFVLVCGLLVFHNNVEGTRWNLSKEEDMEFERQLNLLNKPAIKTIHTVYGDAYDCVDFYSQPAFDHPLFQKVPISLPKEVKEQEKFESSLGLKDGGCPIGTVPIKRITKQDLIRQKLSSTTMSLRASNDAGGTHYATCHTIKGEVETLRYKGVGGIISVHNPSVLFQQYSAARLKLVVNGQESIEAGWRVDPNLYGDYRTRLYIRTQVGESNCYNTKCPGFVITNTGIPLDLVLPHISEPGPQGKRYEVPFNITFDATHGNWILQIGPENSQVGYWPKSIFSKPDELPDYADWGGETFNPSGIDRAPMGTGNVLKGDTTQDAFIRKMKIVDENTEYAVDPIIFPYTDIIHAYDVKRPGRVDNDYFEYLMFYGGSGQIPDPPERARPSPGRGGGIGYSNLNY